MTISPPHPNHKFLTVAVNDNEFKNCYRNFSVKAWGKKKDLFHDVGAGDILHITKLWKKKDSQRRSSTNYVLKSEDMDLEVHLWDESEVTCLFSPTDALIKNFDLINTASKIKAVGIVDEKPTNDKNGYFMILKDKKDNVLEVKLKEKENYKLNQKMIVYGETKKIG